MYYFYNQKKKSSKLYASLKEKREQPWLKAYNLCLLCWSLQTQKSPKELNPEEEVWLAQSGDGLAALMMLQLLIPSLI